MTTQKTTTETALELPKPVTISLDANKWGEYVQRMPSALQLANAIEITDNDDFEGALNMINMFISAQNEIVDFFKDVKKSAYDTHRAISGMEKKLLAPWEQAEKIVSNKRISWRELQDKIKKEKEDAESERLKGQIQETVLEQASELAAMGETEAADDLVNRAIYMPAPAVIATSEVPKEEGVKETGNWEIEIVNPDDVQRAFCSPDMKLIRQQVTAFKLKHGINGIKAQWKKSESYARKGK